MGTPQNFVHSRLESENYKLNKRYHVKVLPEGLVSFEWSHLRISFTDLQLIAAFLNSFINYDSKGVI